MSVDLVSSEVRQRSDRNNTVHLRKSPIMFFSLDYGCRGDTAEHPHSHSQTEHIRPELHKQTVRGIRGVNT